MALRDMKEKISGVHAATHTHIIRHLIIEIRQLTLVSP